MNDNAASPVVESSKSVMELDMSAGLEILGAKNPSVVSSCAIHAGYTFGVIPLLQPAYATTSVTTAAAASVGQPFQPHDLIIANADWSQFFVTGLTIPQEVESTETEPRRRAEILIQQQVAWSTHIGIPAITFPFPSTPTLSLNYARTINATLSALTWTQAWFTVPLRAEGVDDTWMVWNAVHTMAEFNTKLSILLELTPELPDEASLNRWLAEPVSAVRIPAAVFLTNSKQFPVLSKKHQAFHNVQFIVSLPTEDPIHPEGGLQAYQLYLNHLNRSMPQLGIVDQFAKGYHEYDHYYDYFYDCDDVDDNVSYLVSHFFGPDFGPDYLFVRSYLQSPLQPLMDNLESSTYAVFEQDPIKYKEYENAIREALLDMMQTDSRIVIMVVGAGRGPLVTRALNAARAAKRNVHVYAVEKNPNAMVTLRVKEQTEWNGQVTVVYGDMRNWKAPEKADILVSELLGSFGDNELSPECLDGAQGFLKDGGISIPSHYSTFIAPLQSFKLHHEVSVFKDLAHIETPYVVKFKAANELANSQELWSFEHPNRGIMDIEPDSPTFNSHNTRYAFRKFKIEKNALMHGIAGYFETTLYKHVKLSIRPQTYSTGMLSWFPIFFPIKTPILLLEGTEVELHFWRMTDTRKVWYEWTVVPNSCTQSTAVNIHNSGGRSYKIGL
ncbi:hypothetical protein SmJEL517_g02820 [Synchytrium microbalum]|uniref:Protein arginine N-methyltransferase n=1 Tax=Synchytrium microbalum TaxID=1806994 RepID=A0A507C492_9FUNG|nr:uncharacterized protein SmJEL517_g02820 [Synchytrium microbalum]TPX34482.1 hypothetical protein SmJEL517_g02820 [Synchytrium microbalum]